MLVKATIMKTFILLIATSFSFGYLPTFQYKIQCDNDLIGFNTNLR